MGLAMSQPVRAAQFSFSLERDSGQVLGTGFFSFDETQSNLTGIGRETISTFGFGDPNRPLIDIEDFFMSFRFDSLRSPHYNAPTFSFPNGVVDFLFTFDSGRLTGMSFMSDVFGFDDFYSSCCNQSSERISISGNGDRWTQTIDVWERSVDLSQIDDPDYTADYREYTVEYTGAIKYTTLEPIRTSTAIPEPNLLVGSGLGLLGMGLKRFYRKQKRLTSNCTK